jgi:sialate O-acetylesterase
LCCFFVALGLALAGTAELSLPSLISNHMMLQQGAKVPIWGKADPGDRVTVQVANRKAKGTACEGGEWMVKLGRLKAGGPYEMTVSTEDESITISDVLVGEVWVCSGQSNMQWSVSNSNNPEKEIAEAKYPDMRLFTVPRVVAGEPQESCEGEWVACTPETIPGFTAVGYFFGRELHQELDVPVGLIHTSWGGTPAEAWTSMPTLEADPTFKPILDRWEKILANYPQAKAAYDKKVQDWQKAAEKAKAEGKKVPGKPRPPFGPGHPHRPSGLYNAMIAPLVPYAIQGAIWYQGESNAGRAYQYRDLFPTMITDWRESWDQRKGLFKRQDKFPFLFVQLANFRARESEPVESDWAELREAQLMTLDLKNTGMAVIIDIGEADDIHPRNKQDVGKRLALAALAETYKERVAYSGPIYRSMRIRGDEVTLRFEHTDGGLVAKGGGELKGFAVAGIDRTFVWADAKIDGKKVVVSSDQVPNPVAVRYGWANNPECNLYNGADLPASPFRTDAWPGVTISNK